MIEDTRAAYREARSTMEEGSVPARRFRPTLTRPTTRGVLVRRQTTPQPFTDTPPTSAKQQQLKRTHSDPNLPHQAEERRECFSRWAFIRQQPEYRRLVWAMKVKTAFGEQEGPQEGGRVQKRDQASQTDLENKPSPDMTAVYSMLRPRGQSADRKGKGSADRKKGKPYPVTGILRTQPVVSVNPDRKVRFKEAPVLPGGKVSRQTSTESLAPEVRRATSAAPNRSGRKQFASNVSLPEKSGVGQISLQMSDFHRPGITKTMSVNYSSSILSQNSRILSEDLIRLSNKKDVARQAFVKRTERRLRILRKNRELREQTKAERDRRARMDDDQAASSTDSAYFRQPETTILARPSSAMEELLTSSEKKEFRNERIKERTMLLPENYRTANYMKDFGDAQARTVSSAAYLRSAEDGDNPEDVTIDVFRL